MALLKAYDWPRLATKTAEWRRRPNRRLRWVILAFCGLQLATLPAPALCGGVIFFSSNPPLSANNYASLQVFLSPTQAVQAGALWRLHGDAEWSQSGDTRTVVSNTAVVEFNGFPGGWSQPT